jgi:low affinity Fe/Cu permease
MEACPMLKSFHLFAKHAAEAAGSPWSFIIALGAVLLWLAVGPWFHFSDTWQLTINTASSIIPTLMVFLIQNTQNRDSKVLQLKLDALLADVDGKGSAYIKLEYLSDEAIENAAQRLMSAVETRRAGARG